MEVSSALGPVSGMLRLLRGTTIGIVMVLTGVIGHVGADGVLPGAGAIAMILVLNTLVATAFTGRPMPIRYIVLLVVAGQTVVHVGLSLTAGHVGEAALASAQVVNGHVVVSVAWQQLLSDLAVHAPMMVAHLMGAAAVGMWLGVGERALWALIADAHTRLIRPVIVLRAALAGVRIQAEGSLPALPTVPMVRPRVAALARCVVRRGPPALLAA